MSRSFDPCPSLEICILAGGLSSRIGRDKAELRLGRQTLLAQIRKTAKKLHCRVRAVRKDAVPRCGPLGGVYTGLIGSKAGAVLFLSCDMPFVSQNLLSRVAGALPERGLAAFVAQPDQTAKTVGFPFILRREALPVVRHLLAEGRCSLQNLAASLRAKVLRVPKPLLNELFNINTPADWQKAREFWRENISKLENK